MKVHIAILTTAALCLALALLHARPAQEQVPAEVIEMTAKKYEYDPAEIRVKAGTRVQLKVRALDRTHGLRFELYPEGAKEEGPPGLQFAGSEKTYKLEKEKEQVIEFVAERPGTYEFECSVFCGFGHGRMKGKLIVEER